MQAELEFQAKDIQRIIGIKKYRYEYLASKIGIKPEIEEVEKTGHTHLYSFKNLFEFGIVNVANNLGVGPKASREILNFLSHNPDLEHAGLFDPKKKIEVSIHYADTTDGKFSKLSGASLSKQGRKGGWIGEGFDVIRKAGAERKAGGVSPELMKAYANIALLATTELDELPGHITVNLGVIKNNILSKL